VRVDAPSTKTLHDTGRILSHRLSLSFAWIKRQGGERKEKKTHTHTSTHLKGKTHTDEEKKLFLLF
jgi:hypothetical protein